MKDIGLRPGDKVQYIGACSPHLKNLIGQVVDRSPRGDVFFNKHNQDSVPVMWEKEGYYGVYYYGVYRKNISKIEAHDWEV